MHHFVITGTQGGQTQDAAAPNRREINDLINDVKQFSLYIQALSVMQHESQSDIISHFGVAGIHGQPFVQWDSAGGTNPVPGSGFDGYCTHGSVLFPTWHRPYVALYEQVMQSHALNIAEKYQVDRDSWRTAARNLRAPYWDWASPGNIIPPPEVISLQSVPITTFDGSTIPVSNPLYQYKFHPIEKTFYTPFKLWQTTLRHPHPPGSPDATTDVQELREHLSSIQTDVTGSTWRLLTQVQTWPEFSNHTPNDGGSAINSLEAIHDNIHTHTGWGGHMGSTYVAGFDPIFFLHHANVDRILALWSAINPGTWVTPAPAEGGTWTISGNATIDTNTSLTPFWNTQTGFWTSSEVTRTETLHYSYPEFNNLDMSNPDVVKQAISSYVNHQYGDSSGELPRFHPGIGLGPAHVNLLAQPAAGGAPPQVARGDSSAAAEEVRNPSASQASHPYTAEREEPERGGPDVVHDWTVRIRFKKYELRQSFAVLLFLGEVPKDHSQWITAPTFVGSHTAFVNNAPEQCANCRSHLDAVSEGFVHLNSVIASRSGLSSYDPQVISPYVKENLHWRVQAVDRSVIPLDRIPSLEVTVASTILTRPPGSVFPITGPPHYHHHITYGRQGGARHAQA